MTLWQLKTFAVVAKEGSFTKAGKVLHISQPSVSALIIGLQKELGVKLFERLGTRPHLTEAGRRLLKLVASALGTIEKIQEEMDQVRGLKKGRLAVGGSGFAGATLLPVVIQSFKKAFGSIEVSLMIHPSAVLEEKLLNGDLDVGLLGIPAKSPLIIARPYREERIVVIAPANHPLARKRTVPLQLVAKEPIIIEERSGGTIRKMVESLFAKKGLEFAPELTIDAVFGSRDAIKTAVASGLGLAFIPEHQVALDVHAGRLKILAVPEVKLKRVMYLAFHKRRQNPLVQTFIEFLRTYNEQQIRIRKSA
jgi:DNA-binding transcriptional LysR family regulator